MALNLDHSRELLKPQLILKPRPSPRQLLRFEHEHARRAARRARRRQQLQELIKAARLRLDFRIDQRPSLQIASDLLDSDHPTHHATGRRLYAQLQHRERLQLRDARLRAGQHPGDSDGRYRAAWRHAQRWGLPAPRWEEIHTVS